MFAQTYLHDFTGPFYAAQRENANRCWSLVRATLASPDSTPDLLHAEVPAKRWQLR
jgi:hypothetical protein